MYQLNSAIAKYKTPGSPWLRIDVSAMTLAEIFSTFEEVYFEVSSPYWPTNRSVLVSELRPLLERMDMTITDWLVQRGTETIPSQPGLATVKHGRVSFADAYWSGYDLQRGQYARSPDYIPDATESDCLILRKEGVDPHDLVKNCLVTINGLIHRTDSDGVVNYVIDAYRTVLNSGRHEVGIINFKNVSSFECVSITADMVHRRDPDQPMANQLYIKSPVATEGKTVGLVMGGYLHLLDNFTFIPVGNDIFCLDVQNMPMLDRFFESEKIIDLSSFELERRGKDKRQLSRQQLLSDEVLIKWLTLSQSFLVLFENDTITVEREQVERGSTWGMYVTPKEPKAPLVSKFGGLFTYTKSVDDGMWTLTVGHNTVNNLLANTAADFNSPNPADNRVPHNREEISPAFLLHIYTDRIVIN